LKKILVTGGTGYIGSHTVVELINKGYDVLIVDDLSNSDRMVLDRIQEITGKWPAFECLDLRDKVELNRLIKNNSDIVAIIHFAAKKAVGESVEKPLLYYEVNVGGMINLLQSLAAIPDMAFVFSSSCTVYGQPEHLPVSEQSPILPAESPYGNTKQICENILADFCKVNDVFKAISLRYFNPVGAHESALIGELPRGVPNNLVPFITQVAIGLRDQLQVYGNDYDTIDGTAVRDYIHITDLAKAHVIALERLLQKKFKSNYEFFNLGTGKGNSVLEVIKAFEKVSGQKLNYKITARRAGDVEKIYADTSLASTELGWKSELDLESMMNSAWKWQQHLNKQQS
jgi:UDP-glucose 4-epimerase